MRLFLVIISLFFMHSGMAQYRRHPEDILNDSSVVITRAFSAEKMHAYKSNQDFQYNRYKEPPISFWDRFWGWFWGKIANLLSTKGGLTIFQTVFILLAVLVLGFFVYKLTGMNKAGLFKRNAGDVSGYSVADEDIHSINFEQAIADAIKNNNYRLAVRLLYLQSLKRLTDKNLINWQLNKTNIAYVQELQGSNYQSAFSNLTLQFENNWYGDMPIDNTEFNEVYEQFNQFNRQLV
jgi:hypothetical protein